LPSEYSGSTDSLTMYSSVLELFAGFTSRWALAGVAPVTSRPQPSVSATSQWGNSRRDRCRPARFIIRAVPVRILHDRPKRSATLRYPWRSDGILGPTIHATVDAISPWDSALAIRLVHGSSRPSVALLLARAQRRRAAELNITGHLRSDLLSHPR